MVFIEIGKIYLRNSVKEMRFWKHSLETIVQVYSLVFDLIPINRSTKIP